MRNPLDPVKKLVGYGLDIVGMNGEANADYQNAYTTEQLKMQRHWALQDREYNTPANQMSRYRAAGINPYMALGDINAGNASETSPSPVGSGNPANPLASSILSFAAGLPVSLSQSKNLQSEAKLTDAQAESQGIQNKFQAQKNELEIEKMQHDKDISKETADKLKSENKFASDTYDDSLRKAKDDARLASAQADAEEARKEQEQHKIQLVDEMVRSAKTQNEQAAQRFAMELQEIASRIDLNRASAKNQINQAAKALAEKYGIEYDTGLKKQLEDFVVRTHQAQVREQESRAWVQKQTEGSQVENYKEGVKQNKYNTKILKSKSEQPLFPFIGLETTQPFSIPDIKLGRGASSRW